MKKILDGKNIIVTGTAKGMGRQMVELFAENGSNVFAHARTETEEREEVHEQDRKLHGNL